MTSLPRNQQWGNVALYSCINCLTYLAAPVVYVGITQASLCASLGASDTVANLPTSASFWAVIVPVVIAARFHTVSATRHVLAAAYALLALASLVVVLTLWWPLPALVRMSAVILYGGLAGAAIGVRNVYLWEIVNRGIAGELRGWAYSLSFGVGPLFAVAGSLLAQLLLTGQVELPLPSPTEGFTLTRLQMTPLAFPLNFLTVFGATVPVLGLAAILASRFKLPTCEEEQRPLRLVASIAQSVGEMNRDRILLLAIVAYVLVDAGGTITNNMSLYNAEILHSSAAQFAGYQNALRFSCKMIVGLVLGWLLVRTHAKMGMVVTALFCISGILGALTLSNSAFLLCFGLMGAGELYGIYYLNYIMARSHPGRLRQNMAMLQLLSLATSIAPAAFGALGDNYGLPTSFIAAACVVACSLALIVFGLPARPMPPLEVRPAWCKRRIRRAQSRFDRSQPVVTAETERDPNRAPSHCRVVGRFSRVSDPVPRERVDRLADPGTGDSLAVRSWGQRRRHGHGLRGAPAVDSGAPRDGRVRLPSGGHARRDGDQRGR